MPTGMMNSNACTEGDTAEGAMDASKRAPGTASARHHSLIVSEVIPQHPRQKTSSVPIDTPLFSAHPPVLTFSGYRAFVPTSQIVRLRNVDTQARHVRVIPPESSRFSISPFHRFSTSETCKVAPGMEVTFRVTLTADDVDHDYDCDLIVVTEREQFTVPVHAIGVPAALDFPPVISFETCPTNYTTTQAHLLRNAGRRQVDWSMTATGPFRVSPTQGVLDRESHVQVLVEFDARALADVAGQIVIAFDKGKQRRVTTISACAHDVDISLEHEQVDLPSAYIHLVTRSTVRLFNDSDIPVRFSWNANPDRDTDERERQRLLASLPAPVDPPALDVVGEPSDDDEGADVSPELMRARARRARERDLRTCSFPFASEHFTIEPAAGEVFPGGFIEFTVSFCPTASETYVSTAYVDVGGRSSRLPLTLKGTGIGPAAVFSFDSLDIGQVYVNAIYNYQVVLKNIGEIDAEFALTNPDGSTRFRFEPSSGRLSTGQSETITITFSCTTMGPFQEVLQWTLKGSLVPLQLVLSGTVQAPSFDVDVEQLDFGRVSYGFNNARRMALKNTSDIPIKYVCRCPRDGSFHRREFDIQPAVGAILPRQSATITVTLCSETIQEYDAYAVVVDIEGVAQNMKSIPIRAQCVVPEITFPQLTVNFKKCFLRYKYEQALQLANGSDLPVKFEVLTANEVSRAGSGSLSFEYHSGTILPRSTLPLKIGFQAESLGDIEMLVYVRTCGSSEPPMQVTVSAVGIGARLIPSKALLDWRDIPVLKPAELLVRLRNETPIEARYVAFHARKQSPFRVRPNQGTVQPGDAVDLVVQVTCNDNVAFRDVLHILVDEGEHVQIPCRATGVGTTITSPTDLSLIDLSHLMTMQVATRVVRLDNYGERPQTLTWACAAKSALVVEPARVTIQPMSSVMFTILSRSATPGPIDELWTITSLIQGDKEPTVIYETHIVANFVNPHVEFSLDGMQFVYKYDRNHSARTQRKTAKMKNACPLPIVAFLGVKAPFTVDRLEVSLAPGESIPIEVTFDLANESRHSECIRSQLVVSHRNHPARDHIDLVAQIWFPNLLFDKQVVTFGPVLPHTSRVERVVARNASEIPAAFHWALQEPSSQASSKKARAAAPGSAFPVNEVFDIWPAWGEVPPGGTQAFDLSFFGHAQVAADCTALCQVEGGPTYAIDLRGDAATVEYTIDAEGNAIDFGNVDFHAVHERDLTVCNTGRVAVDVRVQIADHLRSRLSVRPCRASLAPGARLRLHVRIVPRRPQAFAASFDLFVAFHRPVSIAVRAVGICRLLSTSLPGREGAPRDLYLQQLQVADADPGAFGPVPVDVVTGALGTYTCDLGYIVRGTTRRLSFECTNSGDVPVDVDLVAPTAPTPFRLDPAKIVAVPPGASVKVTATYAATSTAAKRAVGPDDGAGRAVTTSVFDLVVVGGGGPAWRLALSCRVIVPEVRLSSDTLEFADVPVGHVRTRYVRLSNPTPVPVDWSVVVPSAQEPVTVADGCRAGTLAPGTHQDVPVLFTPIDGRPVNTRLPIRVAHGPTSDLAVTGRGLVTRLRLERSTVEFAPVLPGAESPAVSVRVTNDGDCDAELFSVDWDDAYLADEQRLRDRGTFDARGRMLVEPRRPGVRRIAELDDAVVAPDTGVTDAGNAAAVSTPWRFVVMTGASDATVDTISKEFQLAVVNVDRVVEHYASAVLDAKAVAAEKKKKKPDATSNENPSSLALSISVQDAMASGAPQYLSGEVLTKLVRDYVLFREGAPLAPSSVPYPRGILVPSLSCKVAVDGPAGVARVIRDLKAAIDNVGDCVGRRFYTIVCNDVQPDPELGAPSPTDDFEWRVGQPEQTLLFDDLDALRAALNDRLSSRELAVVANRIPIGAVKQIVWRPAPRVRRQPGPFRLAGSATRWVVPAGAALDLPLTYRSSECGTHEGTLLFEVVAADAAGKRVTHQVTCRGTAARPDIGTDARSVFVRRGRRPRLGVRQWCSDPGVFDFGAVLVNGVQPGDTAETWRFANTGLFRTTLRIAWDDEPAPGAAPAEPDAAAAAVPSAPAPVDDSFGFEPRTLEVNVGEVGVVKVWAVPKTLGAHRRVLRVRIDDNPRDIVFPMECCGARPALSVEGAGDAPNADPLSVQFDRLLVGTEDARTIHLRNTTKVGVRWEIRPRPDQAVPAQIEVSPKAGSLAPGAAVSPVFRFLAAAEVVVDLPLELLINDTNGVHVETRPIRVQAEAFVVKANVELPPGALIDFGTTRVGDVVERKFVMNNRGKYDVGFALAFTGRSGRLRRDLANQVQVEPMSGKLSAGTSAGTDVVIRFKTVGEMDLRAKPVLRLDLIETTKSTVVESTPIRLSIASRYSKFRLAPSRSIHFGSMQVDVERQKTFDLVNAGEFPFDYRLSDEDHPPGADSGAPLAVAGFTVSPGRGRIAPGTTQTVTVDIHATQEGVFRAVLPVIVSGVDPAAPPVEVELTAEAVNPRLNTTDFESIFEEQQVIGRAPPAAPAGAGAHGPVPPSGHGHGPPRNAYALEERQFRFAPVIVDDRSSIKERFKMSNPGKIPCDVNLSLTGNTDNAFDVQPTHLHIPSHEHRYVTVTFAPSAIRTYQAAFSATVDRNPSCVLQFEMQGEGTLPRVSTIAPVERTPTGAVKVDFGRTRRGTLTLPVTVRNDGIVPATVRFDLDEGAGEFSFSGLGSLVTIAPGAQHDFQAGFAVAPGRVGARSGRLRMGVLRNVFEVTHLALSALVYEEDVTADDDVVDFGDVDLGVTVQRPVQLQNESGRTYRFEWAAQDLVTVEPNAGHIHPHSSLTVLVGLNAPAPVDIRRRALHCQLNEILLADANDASPWTDAMHVVSFADGQERTEAVPEPEWSPGERKSTLALAVNAVADRVSYTCSTRSIAFAATMMFQARAYRFTIANAALTRLPYAWRCDPPWTIAPDTGAIDGKGQETFVVKFLPTDARAFTGSIRDAAGRLADLVIDLSGEGRRPQCHFDLVNCDYLTAARRSATCPGPKLDANLWKVVEFTSLGTRVRNTRRFQVVNPTGQSWAFEWRLHDGHPVKSSAAFTCATPKGVVKAGKRFEMVFEFTPDATALQEAFWRFEIADLGVQVPFLLVGTVTEPDVTLSASSLHFAEMLVGSAATETVYLVNNEHIPFQFHADAVELHQAPTCLRIDPAQGVVPPNARLPLAVTLTARHERTYNVNVVFRIRKKSERVSLNIKADGYAVHDQVELDGRVLSPSDAPVVDFGDVHVVERVARPLRLTNNGKFKFDFAWSVLVPAGAGRASRRAALEQTKVVQVHPQRGTIGPGQDQVCEVAFQSRREVCLDDVRVCCRVANAHLYTIGVRAQAVRPHLDFSWRRHAFGRRYVFTSATPVTHTAPLVVTNREPEQSVSIELVFTRQAHLDVQGAPAVMLAPGESATFQVRFTPRAFTAYRDVVQFDVNGFYKVDLVVVGEGVAPRIDLVDVANGILPIGALRPGQTSTSTFALANNSVKSAVVAVHLQADLDADRLLDALSVSPATTTIRPRDRAEFTVAFRPTGRLLPFTVDVAVELDASGVRQHLLHLTGACHGVGLLLEQTLVPFGAVIAGSTLTKRVKVDNIGDVPSRFQWDVARLPQAWALEPATGVIAPHDHALIDVTFAPDVPGLDLRQTLRCVPDDNDAGAVQVQVTGSSVDAPADAAIDLAFDAAVRGSQTVQVPITNTSTSVWQLHPVISDGAWSATDLEVPAGATCNLAVVYAPLTTAADLHRGTLFMALPTGSALSYRLQGRTQAPALESDGACQVRAKCASTHTLPVRNWLHDPQRFRIDIQRESPPDDTVSITAGDSVGVPGGVSRDVRLQIYAYRPGTTVALVKFVNDDNGEYLVHRLTVVAADAGVIDRIALQSPVRQRALATVSLDNRLSRDCSVTSFTCESPDVDVRGLPIRLVARRETLVSIAYRPLVVARHPAGPQRVRLTLSSPELGDFPLELELQAHAAAVDASLRFDAYLGATCTQRFRFLSWSKKPTTYECSFVGGQAFQVVGDKKVTCAGADANGDTGVECQVTVLFDPSGLNDVRDELKVTSADAGEYRCALHGHCSVPRPEGPISITAGASQAVRFRNVFGQRSEFVYTVDNPAFTIGKKGETIDTKKEVSIQVGFQGAQPTNGKLVVTCTGGADQATVPPWVYYLHGEPKK